MMETTIRPVRENEIQVLLEFEQGIIESERPFDSSLQVGEIHYYDLLKLIQSADAAVVVAEVDAQVVGSGYAKICLSKPYQKHEYYVYLGFMYVKPNYRGRGINKMILDSLISWAKEKNIAEVRLEVYEENSIAKKAYAKAGFKPNLLEMRMEI